MRNKTERRDKQLKIITTNPHSQIAYNRPTITFSAMDLNSSKLTPLALKTDFVLQIKYRYYRGAEKSLDRPGRTQARKHVWDVRDFNNMETRAVIKFFFIFLQGKAPKEMHAILTETLVSFLPGRAKVLSATLY